MSRNQEHDWMAVGIAVVAFGLPLLQLVPRFYLWDLVPKVSVERFHFISKDLTWTQTNMAIVSLLVFFFSLYLEIRKRKLDDMLNLVLTVTEATDETLKAEEDHRLSLARINAELLKTSAEHYENLILLRDSIFRKEKVITQHPPIIEMSGNTL